MRKYYIDNLRTLCILLLFPYHTCMIYNSFETFYVHGAVVRPLSDFILLSSTWFMPLMFVIAGISASLALKKRTAKEYARERFVKLTVPLLYGILLLVPVQTYFAERFHNGYTGGYFYQYVLFFTKPTDLSGYQGGFTPAHLWFIFYLVCISLVALPIMLWYNKSKKVIDGKKLTLLKLLPMFLIPLVMTPIFDISGKSAGEFFALFMLGFFVLSLDDVIDRLEKNRWLLSAFAAVLLVIRLVLYDTAVWQGGLLFDIYHRAAMWVCILAILGLGKHFANFTNKAAAYFADASFPIYIFHQTWVIAVGYYVLKLADSIALQVALIISISFLLTLLTYEITKRFSVTRYMFGIKKTKTKEKQYEHSVT